MAVAGFETEAISSTVKDVTDLAPPATATHCLLQATGNSINYTMDGSTDPSSTEGMRLVLGNAPEQFLIEDLKNIKFVREGSTDAVLNITYIN